MATYVLLELDGEVGVGGDRCAGGGGLDVQTLGESAGGEGSEDEDGLHVCKKKE